jgi:hypothetical protein
MVGLAWVQRQRAKDLAAIKERKNVVRELPAVSVANLLSGAELSLLLALKAADRSLAAGEEGLPQVVDALHRAVVARKPDLDIPGARGESRGRVLAYSRLGTWLAVLPADGGTRVLNLLTSDEIGRLRPMHHRSPARSPHQTVVGGDRAARPLRERHQAQRETRPHRLSKPGDAPIVGRQQRRPEDRSRGRQRRHAKHDGVPRRTLHEHDATGPENRAGHGQPRPGGALQPGARCR